MVMFSIAAKKRLLIAGNCVLAAAIAACLLSVLSRPEVDSPLGDGSARQDGGSGVLARQSLGPASDYAVIYRRKLRSPLFDPTPEAPARQQAALNAELVGVAVEPGFEYAIFRTKAGKDKLVAIGQLIEDGELVSVADGSATVKLADKIVTLKVKPKEAGR